MKKHKTLPSNSVFDVEEFMSLFKKKHPQRLQFTDSYVVKFSIQKPDGFWETREKVYSAATKQSHTDIEKRWRDDFRGQNIKLVNIIYQ